MSARLPADGAAPSEADALADPALDALARVGERFGGTVRLSADEIRSYARLIGDHNPMHHDEGFARASRFGSLIASGPHLGSIMLGMFATHFTRSDDGIARASLGMQFDTRFAAPVRPDDDIVIAWHIVERTWKPRLVGWVVKVLGTARSARHGTLIECTGTGVVMPASAMQARPT